MSKRFKNKVGDVFEIPLENSENGYGRILIVEYPILFCEFYNITLSQKYSLEELKGMDTILSIWCSNHGLSKGEWNRKYTFGGRSETSLFLEERCI